MDTGVPDPGVGGAVFSGVILERVRLGQEADDRWRTTIAVHDIFEGTVEQVVSLVTPGALTCGTLTLVGQTRVFVAPVEDEFGARTVPPCDGVRSLSAAEAWPVRARYPTHEVGAAEFIDVFVDRGIDTTVARAVAAGLLAGALAMLVALSRRRRRTR